MRDLDAADLILLWGLLFFGLCCFFKLVFGG